MRVVDPDAELLPIDEFELRLAAEVARAARDGLPYAVLTCIPQLLPDERASNVVEAAAACVHQLVRDEDVVGRLTDEIIGIGARETAAVGAQALAHRLQTEFGLRSSHLRVTKWDVGTACLPEDGSTSFELLHAATQAARTRRLRLAS